MYPDAYEVGAQPGPADPLRGAQRTRGRAGRTDLFGLADVEALMRENGISQFTVESTPRSATSASGRFVRHRTRLHEPADRPRPGNGIPLYAADRGDDRPLVIAGGHAAFSGTHRGLHRCRGGGRQERTVLALSDLIRDFKAEGGGSRPHCWTIRSVGRLRSQPIRVGCLPVGASTASSVDTGTPWRVAKHTVSDLDQWPCRSNLWSLWPRRSRSLSRDLPWMCQGCRFCQAA